MFIVYKPLRMKNVEVSNGDSHEAVAKKTGFIRRRFIKIKCS